MSRYRDPQRQLGENLLITSINFGTKHLEMLMFKHTFRTQWQWYSRVMKRIKNDHSQKSHFILYDFLSHWIPVAKNIVKSNEYCNIRGLYTQL